MHASSYLQLWLPAGGTVSQCCMMHAAARTHALLAVDSKTRTINPLVPRRQIPPPVHLDGTEVYIHRRMSVTCSGPRIIIFPLR